MDLGINFTRVALLVGRTVNWFYGRRLANELAPARVKRTIFRKLIISGLWMNAGWLGFSDGREVGIDVATDIELRIC